MLQSPTPSSAGLAPALRPDVTQLVLANLLGAAAELAGIVAAAAIAIRSTPGRRIYQLLTGTRRWSIAAMNKLKRALLWSLGAVLVVVVVLLIVVRVLYGGGRPYPDVGTTPALTAD